VFAIIEASAVFPEPGGPKNIDDVRLSVSIARRLKNFDETNDSSNEINSDSWKTMEVSRLLKLLKDESLRIHFLDRLKVFLFDGFLCSLKEIREEIQKRIDTNKPLITNADWLNSLINDVLNDLNKLSYVQSKAEEYKWTFEDTDTPAKEKLAAFISGFMTPFLRNELNDTVRVYHVSFGRSDFGQLATYRKDWISLNTNKISGWFSWVERYVKGETSAKENYAMVHQIVENILHEHVHAWEGSKEETHNEAFRQRMLNLVLELISLKIAPEVIAAVVFMSESDCQSSNKEQVTDITNTAEMLSAV
jgi:hypothetical protein